MPLNPIDGSSGDDTLNGSTHGDHIRGFSGNDAIYGADSNDLLEGAEGQDVIDGGEGNDRLFGGDDIDVLLGSGGQDTIYGGGGNDEIYSFSNDSGGYDLVFGGLGDDVLYVSSATDGHFNGGGGRDTASFYWLGAGVVATLSGITSGSQHWSFLSVERLQVVGSYGNDTMTGGALDDILYALSGSNQVDAGGGNDIVGYATGEVNVLNGGTGNDILVVHALNGSGLDFAVSGATVSDNYGSVITGFERFQVFGSAFADSVTGGDLKDNFLGGRGDDTLNGGNGNDVLLGQAGNDQLSGDAGNDRLNGGPGYDTMTGGQGADAFIFAQNDAAIDEITDFEASDTIVIRAYIYGIPLPLGAVATLTLGAATTSDPQFIYNATSGLLIWDGDGVTPGHQIELALLSNVPTLLPSDIILI